MTWLRRMVAVLGDRSWISCGSFRVHGEDSGVRFLVLAFWIFCLPGALARIGVVRTVDGHVWSGQVRFTPGRVIVVNPGQGTITSLELTNIVLISFPTNVAPTSAVEAADGSLPLPWREQDIGSAALPGSTRYESGLFTVRGAGRSLDGEADAFHYVFKPVRGDSEIVAELVSVQYTHPQARAGLMIRESLNEYSRHVMLGLTAERGGGLQFRSETRAIVQTAGSRRIAAPYWLKLRRQGDEFTASVSRDGRVWSFLERVSVPMQTNVYVGLAVTSAQEGVLNWSTFSRVREAPRLRNDRFVPEMEMVSGSELAGQPALIDERELNFNQVPGALRVPVARVSRILFQPLSGDMAWKARLGRPGVWVSTGDFFDGEFRGLEGRKLTISSVLYGLRVFDLDDQVLAVVLQPRRLVRPAFEVETMDGATWLAAELAVGDGEMLLREPAVGNLRVPIFEILELRRR